jgi:hypothetical protein
MPAALWIVSLTHFIVRLNLSLQTAGPAKIKIPKIKSSAGVVEGII